jgi:hypothetical protein
MALGAARRCEGHAARTGQLGARDVRADGLVTRDARGVAHLKEGELVARAAVLAEDLVAARNRPRIPRLREVARDDRHDLAQQLARRARLNGAAGEELAGERDAEAQQQDA